MRERARQPMQCAQSQPSPRTGWHEPYTGTSLRFLVLLVVLCVSCVSLVRRFGLVQRWAESFGGAKATCAFAAGFDPNGPRLGNDLAMLRGRPLLHTCLGDTVRAEFLIGLAATGAVLVAAFVLYWWLPVWMERRRRLLPVEAMDPDGELGGVLEELTARAGVARGVRFAVDARAPTAGAVVFGRPGRYTVSLHAGLLVHRAGDPSAFRAVVLHELAHIRNRDVDIAYAAVALWRVFLVAVLVPFAVQQAWQLLEWQSRGIFSSWPGVRPPLLRDVALAAFLVALVHFTRADILRTRELYADRDAVGWGADSAHWGRADAPAAGRNGALAPRTAGSVRAFAEMWRTHPTWEARRRSLKEPSALFRVDGLQMLLLGAAAVVFYDSLPFGEYGLSEGIGAQAVVWPTAALVTAVSGIMLWRAVVHAVRSGRCPPSGLRAGLWLGAGMAAGELVLGSLAGSQLLPVRLWMLVIPVLCAAVATWWSGQWARLVLGAWHGRGVRWALPAGLPAAWGVFGAWLWWWKSEGWPFAAGDPYSGSGMRRLLAASAPGPGGSDGLLSVAATWYPHAASTRDSVIVVAGLGMWLLPLLVLLWSRQNADAPAWVRGTLPSADAAVPLVGRPPRPRRIAFGALFGGAVCWAGHLAVRAYLHPHRPPAGQRSGSYALVYALLLLAVVCLGMAAAAAAAVVQERRHQLLVALTTAGGAALCAQAGLWAMQSADGCLGPFDVLVTRCTWQPGPAFALTGMWLGPVLGSAMYPAGAVALVTVLGMRLWHAATRPHMAARGRGPAREPGPRAVGRKAPPQATVPRGRLAVRRALGLALCVTVPAVVLAWEKPVPVRASQAEMRGALASPPASATTRRVRRVQVLAWAEEGGAPQLPRIIGDAKGYAGTLSAAADHAVPWSAFAKRCAALERDYTDAAALPPIQDNEGQRLWARTLARLHQGNTLCSRAVRERNGKLLTAAADPYTAALNADAALFKLVLRYTDEAERARGRH